MSAALLSDFDVEQLTTQADAEMLRELRVSLRIRFMLALQKPSMIPTTFRMNVAGDDEPDRFRHVIRYRPSRQVAAELLAALAELHTGAELLLAVSRAGFADVTDRQRAGAIDALNDALATAYCDAHAEGLLSTGWRQ